MKYVELKDYISILSGFAFKSSLFSKDSTKIPIIRIRDIKRGFSETFYDGDYDGKYIIHIDDMLVGMDGEFNVEYWKGIPSLLNQRVCKIDITDDTKLYKKYLYYIINGKLKEIEDKTAFVTVKHLSINDINKIQIPLPPLEQQKEIAEKLDKADLLRKKDQELLLQYDELAQAIFIDMFGDPVKNEKGWEMVNFEEVLKLKRGYDLPVQDRNTKGTIPVYGSNGVLDYHDEFKTIKPCLITGRSGTIGKVHISEEFCWPLNTTLYSYETYDNNIFFLHYLLVNLKIERFAHGAGVPTLDRKIVHKEMIPNINKELQNQFAEKIKNIETQKALAKKQAQESEDLFQALLQESFNFN